MWKAEDGEDVVVETEISRQSTATANVRLRRRNITILAGWSNVSRWRSWRIMEVSTGATKTTSGRDRKANSRYPGETEKRFIFVTGSARVNC